MFKWAVLSLFVAALAALFPVLFWSGLKVLAALAAAIAMTAAMFVGAFLIVAISWVTAEL